MFPTANFSDTLRPGSNDLAYDGQLAQIRMRKQTTDKLLIPLPSNSIYLDEQTDPR